MAAPTLVGVRDAGSWSESTSPRVTPAFDAQAGDVLVAVGATETRSITLTTPTNTGGALTWTLRQSITGGNSTAPAYLWTATVDTDRTGMTVSVTRSGTGNIGLAVLQFRGSDGLGASAKSGTASVSGVPSLAITTTTDGSALVCFNADWNATAGARTYRSVNGGPVEDVYAGTAGLDYIVEAFHYPDAGAAGAKTVGMTTPSGQRYALVAVEVLGGTPTAPPATGSVSGAIPVTGSLSGAVKRAGTIAATIALAGSLVGSRPATGRLDGAASVAGQFAGARASRGAVSGSVSATGALTGHRAATGSIGGTVAVAGTLTGSTPTVGVHSGTLTGAIIVTGNLTGSAPAVPAHRGTIAGAVSTTGTLTGSTAHRGTIAGSVPVTGALAGRAPVVGVHAGSIIGTLTVVGSMVGRASHSGAAAGAIGLTGALAGRAPSGGSLDGAVTIAGDLTGSSTATRDLLVLGVTEHQRAVTIVDQSPTTATRDRSRAVLIAERGRQVTITDRG